jgi:glycopeptide antibiotics resistance protein
VPLPGKHPDTTDWFLESLGGILGYVLSRIIRARLSKPARRPARPQWHERDGKLHSR